MPGQVPPPGHAGHRDAAAACRTDMPVETTTAAAAATTHNASAMDLSSPSNYRPPSPHLSSNFANWITASLAAGPEGTCMTFARLAADVVALGLSPEQLEAALAAAPNQPPLDMLYLRWPGFTSGPSMTATVTTSAGRSPDSDAMTPGVSDPRPGTPPPGHDVGPSVEDFAAERASSPGSNYGAGVKPLVLLACGSFSPITNMHLRIFEMARDHIRLNHPELAAIAGIVSPVHPAYAKPNLLAPAHRLRLCRLATATSDWLVVDDWEMSQLEWTPTARVLKHVYSTVNLNIPADSPVDIGVMLLCGADLIDSFNVPGLWADEDLDEIISQHGVVVIERQGTDLKAVIAASPILSKYKDRFIVVPQLLNNDVSSTKVRELLSKQMSIRYLVPDSVAEYIAEHNLFNPAAAAGTSPPSSQNTSPAPSTSPPPAGAGLPADPGSTG